MIVPERGHGYRLLSGCGLLGADANNVQEVREVKDELRGAGALD